MYQSRAVLETLHSVQLDWQIHKPRNLYIRNQFKTQLPTKQNTFETFFLFHNFPCRSEATANQKFRSAIIPGTSRGHICYIFLATLSSVPSGRDDRAAKIVSRKKQSNQLRARLSIDEFLGISLRIGDKRKETFVTVPSHRWHGLLRSSLDSRQVDIWHLYYSGTRKPES